MTHAVLIVDDEATLARNLAAYLERNGFDVRVAGSGEEGLQQFAEFRPDVVLLDHNLPGISGLEAMEILGADPATANIPIIALSANAVTRDIEKALEAGFFNYLTKPIKVNEFMDALHLALEFSKTASARAAEKEKT